MSKEGVYNISSERRNIEYSTDDDTLTQAYFSAHPNNVEEGVKVYSCRHCKHITQDKDEHYRHTVMKHQGKEGTPDVREFYNDGGDGGLPYDT